MSFHLHHIAGLLIASGLVLVPEMAWAVEALPASRLDAGQSSATGDGVSLSASVAHSAARVTGASLDLAGGTGPITGLIDLPILPDIAATVGSPLNRQLAAPWTEAGTWSATGLPEGITVQGDALVGVPVLDGLVVLRLRYTTAAGLYTEQVVSLRIDPNPVPASGGMTVLIVPNVVTGGSKPASAEDLTMLLTSGSDFSYRMPVERGATVVFTGLPSWATDEGGGLIKGTVGSAGTSIVTALATSPAGIAVTTTITLSVTNPVAGTAGPVVMQPVPKVMTLGETLGAPLVIVGDKTGVIFEADGLPPGTRIDPQTGVISGFPTMSGSFVVRIRAVQRASGRATDGTVLARTTVVITVLPKTPVSSDGTLWTAAKDDLTGKGGGCGLGGGIAVLMGAMVMMVVARRSPWGGR